MEARDNREFRIGYHEIQDGAWTYESWFGEMDARERALALEKELNGDSPIQTHAVCVDAVKRYCGCGCMGWESIWILTEAQKQIAEDAIAKNEK